VCLVFDPDKPAETQLEVTVNARSFNPGR